MPINRRVEFFYFLNVATSIVTNVSFHNHINYEVKIVKTWDFLTQVKDAGFSHQAVTKQCKSGGGEYNPESKQTRNVFIA